MVYCRHGKQRWDGGMGGIHVAVGEHDVVHSLVDGLFRLLAEGGKGFLQSLPSFRRFEEQGQLHRLEAFVADVAEDVQLGVVQDGVVQPYHLAVALVGGKDVHAHGTDVLGQRHHQLLAYRVDGRVGDLRELLAEVVVQQLRTVGEHGKRGVVAHGVDGFGTGGTHGDNQPFHVLLGVAEEAQHAVVVLHAVRHLASAFQFVQLDAVVGKPGAVGLGFGKLLLQFAVVVDFTLFGVNQQNLARLQASFLLDVSRLEVHHTHFACHHHHAAFRNEVACRAQPVAVEHAARIASVAEEQCSRTVPRLHQDGVVFVKGFQVFADGVLFVERFRHQHCHGVRQAQSGHEQELKYVVQRGAVAHAGLHDGAQLPDVA